jgi:voltage-gated potassium channel
MRASYRDTLLLLREFRQPLLLFTMAVAGSGWLFYWLAGRAGIALSGPLEAMYITLSLAFLNPPDYFPTAWYLQMFYFLMPVIGIGILAQGLTDFGVMLFNRRARGKEWEMAVASTFSNHVVLIGLGHLGYRVVKKLNELEQDVVAIELAPKIDLMNSVRELGVPVIEDDGTREAALLAAGIRRARVIMLCTQDDSLNLRIALKARSLNPGIEVVIRIFDDDFAASLQAQFGFRAMSATGMAAPMFAATAAQVDITPPLTINGQPHILANLQVTAASRLVGQTIYELEEKHRISIVMQCKNGQSFFHPQAQEVIGAGHTIAIFGEPERINQLLHENHR